MENGGSWLKFARKPATLNVLVGMIGVAIDLNNDGNAELNLPLTGGRYLLAGRGCPDQTGHNDFEI